MSRQIPLFADAAESDALGQSMTRQHPPSHGVSPSLPHCLEVALEAAESVHHARRLILELAVRGRLVEQRPEEGHALDLLREFTSVVGPVEADAEAPYPLPQSWAWSTLGAIGRVVGGGTPKTGTAAYWADTSDLGAVPWLTPADLSGHTAKRISIGRRQISSRGLAESSAQLLPVGSVLFSSRAPIGYVAIAGAPVATNQGFKSIVPHVVEMNEYLRVFLLAAAPSIDAAAPGTTFREVSGKAVAAVRIPLPPLAEQQRIVARVDELMALCDELEAKQAKKRDTGARLTKSALDALTTAEGPEEFEAAWRRVVENFDVLTDRAEKVAEIRAAVRDLAVTGRLTVPWNLPAGTGYRTDGDVPVPESWAWRTLGELVVRTDYGTSQKAHEAADGIAVLRMNNIQDGKLSVDALKYVPADTENLDSLMLEPGDLLFNRTNSYELVGKMAVFRELGPFTFASYLIRARVDRTAAVPEYINIYFGSRVCRRTQIEPHITRQTNQANFNGTKLKDVSVPTPDVEEQMRIVTRVDELMALCDHLEAKLRRADDAASRAAAAMASAIAS